ncbi:SDR family NAD(P)-dependent oxidoreductase [Microbacterium sp. NPDC086615]|jgi:NAD(P)-dependent dehydrogenase (short-subunit alcohol dehydrogenase family)|uniref:SDR family NAD(P)-dependent oxidoreductase n=1 Tax=Microbacterium sp. NPDC086615 TaxID=3154865 RepID=UPI00343440FB|nr:family oxidoreductase [Microbacterium sp.]
MPQTTSPRTFLVSGGASGIGEATVRQLVARGDRVAIVDRDAVRLATVAEELGVQVLALEADVSSEQEVEKTTAHAVRHFGCLDGAFLNAAVPGPFQSLMQTSAADFDRVIAIDLRGVFLGLRETMRHLTGASRAGSIVVTSSLAGLTAGRGLAAYTAAKHGVIGLVRNAAVEGAAHGIRVNCIAPGLTDTPLQAPLREFHGAQADALQAQVPLGRMGDPREAAELACFLLSDAAGYLTGAVIPIDGGALADSPLRTSKN